MNENKKKIGWKPAFELFSQVSAWVIVPIVLALIAGKAMDRHYGTDPWIFLGLTAVAFLFSIFGIVRVVSEYMKRISPDLKSESRPEEKNKKDLWKTDR